MSRRRSRERPSGKSGTLTKIAVFGVIAAFGANLFDNLSGETKGESAKGAVASSFKETASDDVGGVISYFVSGVRSIYDVLEGDHDLDGEKGNITMKSGFEGTQPVLFYNGQEVQTGTQIMLIRRQNNLGI